MDLIRAFFVVQRSSVLSSVPMPASPIIGHASQLQELANDLKADNISHAYLFTGPSHSGKFTVAKWFMKQLLLKDVPAEDRERQEHEIDRLIHPDLLQLDQLWMEEECEDWDVIAQSSNVSQVHRSKAPKMKTDTIGIDDVRVLQERLYETGRGARRCCLIRSLERMRDEAGNAFLKILEEPPAGRVFLLTAESESAVLPTLTSRTRILHFHPVGDRDMRSIVKDVPQDDAQFLLHIGQGAPGRVLRLMNDPDALRAERLLHTQAIAFWNTRSLSERFSLLSPLTERGKEADRFLLHLSLALRESRDRTHRQERALSQLVSNYQTNAHRTLLAQRFALSVSV